MQEQTVTENSDPPPPPSPAPALDGAGVYKGFPIANMLAFPVGLAAKVMGMCRTKLYYEICQGKIRKTSAGVISREEIVRYLRAETA